MEDGKEFKELGACQAIVQKIQTTADGGARITLDLPATDKKTIKELLDIKLGNDQIVFASFAVRN